MEVPHTQAPFIVLENTIPSPNAPNGMRGLPGLHVISLAEKELKLGRGHESDVRISDVSISRCHAMVRFENGQFLLRDNNSKFGTLVALKKPRQLTPDSPFSIQMGRTVLNFKLKPGNDGRNSDPNMPPVPPGVSRPEDERALRLSLMNRGSAQREEGASTGQQNSSTLPVTAQDFF